MQSTHSRKIETRIYYTSSLRAPKAGLSFDGLQTPTYIQRYTSSTYFSVLPLHIRTHRLLEVIVFHFEYTGEIGKM